MSSQLDLLKFDFDGPFNKQEELVSLAWDVYLAICHKRELTPITRARFEELRGASVIEILKSHQIKPKQLLGYEKDARRFFSERVDSLSPAEGLGDVLERLKTELGLQLEIVTSNSREAVKYFLRKYGFTDYFSQIYAGCGILSKTLHLVSVNGPSGYVCDTRWDIGMAKLAGNLTMAVTYGLGKNLREANPTYLVSNPQEIFEHASCLCS